MRRWTTATAIPWARLGAPGGRLLRSAPAAGARALAASVSLLAGAVRSIRARPEQRFAQPASLCGVLAPVGASCSEELGVSLAALDLLACDDSALARASGDSLLTSFLP